MTIRRERDLCLTLDHDQQQRAQERLRSLLIDQPWYAAQDKCYGLEFWRALLWLILVDPATKLADGTPITPRPIPEAARTSSRIPYPLPEGWMPGPHWPGPWA